MLGKNNKKAREQKAADKVNRYSIRRLSVGVVSVAVGSLLFLSNASVAQASVEELDATDETVEVSNETIDESEDEEDIKAADYSSEKLEVTTGDSQDSPISELEIGDELSAESVGAGEGITPGGEEIVPEEDVTPEPPEVEETEEEGVITDISVTIEGGNKGDENKGIPDKSGAEVIKPLGDNPKEPNEDMTVMAHFSFNIPDSTKEGDQFTVKISDNLNTHGVGSSKKINNLIYNGEVVATAELQPDGRTIIYTFNDKVNDISDVELGVGLPLFIDKEGVKNSTKGEEFKVTVEDIVATKSYDINYKLKDHSVSADGSMATLSGVADIDQTSMKGERPDYRHTIYVNPDNQRILNSNIVIENAPGSENAMIFDDEVMNSIKVYRVDDKTKLNESFYVDENEPGIVDVTQYTRRYWEPYWQNGQQLQRLGINIDQGWSDKTFIIRYTGKRLPEKTAKSRTYFSADNKIQPNGAYTGPIRNNWTWDNEVHFTKGKTEIVGDERFSLGNRVWYDENGNGIQDDGEKGVQGVKVAIQSPPDKNGKVKVRRVTTDENGNYKFAYIPDANYTVQFKGIPEGYKLTKKDQGDDDEKDSDGYISKQSGNIIAIGKVDGKDNMSVDIGIVKTEGKFQEHHVYQELDYDGKVVKETVIKGEMAKGMTTENYTTSAKPNGTETDQKEGFELVEVEDVTKGKSEKVSANFNEDGAEATGKFVDNETLEVKYVYQKQPGRFVEKHIYKDGDTVVETDSNEDKPSEGYKNEQYETQKKDKEGYKLVEVKSSNGAEFSNSGEREDGHFKPGETLEVTYVYEKIKQGKVVVHYVDEEGNSIKEDVEDTPDSNYGTKYDTSDKKEDEITTEDGKTYVFKEIKTGDKETGSIDKPVTEVTYIYTEKKDEEPETPPVEKQGKVIVHYVDEEGNTIKEDVEDTPNSDYGTKYDTSDKKEDEITTEDGKTYVFKEIKTGDKETGSIDKPVTEVTYIYTEKKDEEPETPPVEKQGKVIVHYVDEEGNTIKEDVEDTPDSNYGTKYDTSDKKEDEITTEDGKTYVFKEIKTGDVEKGTVDKPVTEVTYIYTEKKDEEPETPPVKKQGKVIVKYVDEEGNPLKDDVVDTEKSKYETEYDTTDNKPKTIEKDGKTYELVKVKDGDVEKGTIDKPETTVTYIYKLKEDPQTPDPDQPGTEDPDTPGTEDPDQPGGEDPSQPGGEDPDQPGEEDPDQPGEEDPSKPGEEDPSKPGEEDPDQPGEEDPDQPGGEDPDQPGGEDPDQPGEEDPDQPGGEDSDTPGTEDPDQPGTEDPDQPGVEDPDKPGTEDSSKPGEEDPSKPGKEDPSKPGTEDPVPVPSKDRGIFKETHIYITVDENGKEISRETVETTKEGKDGEEYTTGKKEKEDFTFVEEKDKDSSGKFINNKSQKVTYVYKKVVKSEEPGVETPIDKVNSKFIETHVYITKDKNGKEIKREVVKVTKEGKDGQSYTTGKNEKDGFVLVGEKDKDSSGKYIEGKDQKVTYIYEKTVEDPVQSDEKDPNPSDKPEKPQSQADDPAQSVDSKQSKETLPQTGQDSNALVFGAAAMSILAGLGLVDKRREEEN